MRDEPCYDFRKKIIMIFARRGKQSSFCVPASETVLGVIRIAILMFASCIQQFLKEIARIFSACLSGYHPHPLYVVCLLGLQARAGAGALRRRSG